MIELLWAAYAPPRVTVQRSSAWESVIPLADNAWLIQALQPVWALRQLPRDWDSYGSPEISEVAVHRAARVLSALNSMSPTFPNVVPIPGGGIQLEWFGPGGELEISCGPDGIVTYLADLKSAEPDDGILTLTDDATVQSLVHDTMAS